MLLLHPLTLSRLGSLACAAIPITVSIILILRARGVCCVPPGGVPHRIDRPPTGKQKTETAADAPAGGTPAPADPAAELDDLFGVPANGAAPPVAPVNGSC